MRVWDGGNYFMKSNIQDNNRKLEYKVFAETVINCNAEVGISLERLGKH